MLEERFSAAHGGLHGAETHAEAHGGSHTAAGYVSRRTCVSWRAHAGANPWKELCPTQDPCWSSLSLKDCTPWKGAMLEQFMKDCIPWEGHHAGVGKNCEDKGAAETKCYEITTSPCSLFLSRRRRKKSQE